MAMKNQNANTFLPQFNVALLAGHAVGDIFVACYRGASVATPIGVPAAGGTVPQWNVINNSSSAKINWCVCWARATATNMTTGLFTGVASRSAMIFSFRPLAGRPGRVVDTYSITNNDTGTSNVIAWPFLAAQDKNGTSVGVRFALNDTYDLGWSQGSAGAVLTGWGPGLTGGVSPRLVDSSGAERGAGYWTTSDGTNTVNLTGDQGAMSTANWGSPAGFSWRAITIEVTDALPIVPKVLTVV
jgi:hypothetical protein